MDRSSRLVSGRSRVRTLPPAPLFQGFGGVSFDQMSPATTSMGTEPGTRGGCARMRGNAPAATADLNYDGLDRPGRGAGDLAGGSLWRHHALGIFVPTTTAPSGPFSLIGSR